MAVAVDHEMAQAAKTTLPGQLTSKSVTVISPPTLVIHVAKTYVRPIARCTCGLLLSSRDASLSWRAAPTRATLPVRA
jgi:hypothetical protein